jgi:hypothetical protein
VVSNRKRRAILCGQNPDQQPYWTPQHSRIAGSRAVKVEVVVNGRPAASQILTADGSLRELTFDALVERSSWVALRILGSAHPPLGTRKRRSASTNTPGSATGRFCPTASPIDGLRIDEAALVGS